MSHLKTVVALTNSNMEKMSRFELLNWINTHAQTSHTKVEELCSGVAYCLMMEQIFPQCIGVKKIKTNAKLEHEFLHNLKLIQAAMTRMKFNNPVPIDRIIKGRFQDNFEYLQWFKKFYDTFGQSCVENNNSGAQKPTLLTITSASNTKIPPAKQTKGKTTPTNNNYLKTPNHSNNSSRDNSVSPDAVSVLQKSLQQLSEQRNTIDGERKVYYNKLLAIEVILKKAIEDKMDVELAKRTLRILYNHGEGDQDSGDIEFSSEQNESDAIDEEDDDGNVQFSDEQNGCDVIDDDEGALQ